MMQIFVKNLEGKSIALEVDSTGSIDSLRAQIEERCSVPAEDQLLTAGGKVLDGDSLADHDISHGATVHLSLRLRGGFGAGNIPSFSYLEGKAYRHGDIEDSLGELLKRSSGMLGGLGRSNKFGGLDTKRVYYGNWLRDYSQAMDCAALTKMPKQSILNLVMGLGFLAHGYATGEFEVTDERLGVYLCTEHIDNPKGYASDQPGGDARHLDPRLRGPVDPRELEIDPRTGMKNYIANENGTWDTSSRLVRERINQCIAAGRRARQSGNEADMHECYRLLGTFLHTLEDWSAHSNWVELSLRRLGYKDVFCHVGEAVTVQTPAGPAPPIVTGTFGGADFMHSMLGEASDKLSEASVSDLSKAMDGANARSINRSGTDELRDMIFQLPGSTGGDLSREMNDVEGIRSRANAGDASMMSPQELHAQLWQVLTFRDNVVKGIERTIEKIPGLSSLVEKLTDSINRFVFTTLEPLLKPLMGQATSVLQTGSAQVLNAEDQEEVFKNPNASDPTHSFLSKDHFNAILNEPAGMVAVVVLKHAVNAVVKAWEHDDVDTNAVATEILKTFHHPYFFDNTSAVQREMGATLKSWIDGQNHEDKTYILGALTKNSVLKHLNKRKGHVQDQVGHGCGGQYNSFLSPEKVSAFASANIPGASNVIGGFNTLQNTFSSAQHYVGREGEPGFVDASAQSGSSSYNQSQNSSSYNNSQSSSSGGGYNPSYGGQDNYQQQQSYQPPPQSNYDSSYQSGYSNNGYGTGGQSYGQGYGQPQGGYGGPPPPSGGGYGGPPGGGYGGPGYDNGPPAGFHQGPPPGEGRHHGGGGGGGYPGQQHHSGGYQGGGYQGGGY